MNQTMTLFHLSIVSSIVFHSNRCRPALDLEKYSVMVEKYVNNDVLFCSFSKETIMTDAIIASKHDNVVTGMWKFARGTDAETLVSFALECQREPVALGGYLHLYVRGASKDQLAIGFQYDLHGRFTQKQFFHRMTDKIKRRFGNDFVGWDLSSPTWIIPV